MIVESAGVGARRERRSVVEDALDDGGVLGRSGAEVPGRGVEGSVSEQGLDLGCGRGTRKTGHESIMVLISEADPDRQRALTCGISEVPDGIHFRDRAISEAGTSRGAVGHPDSV